MEHKLVEELERVTDAETAMNLRRGTVCLPSESDLREFIYEVSSVVFPGYFGTGVPVLSHLHKIMGVLGRYVDAAVAEAFIERLPEVKRLLLTDVEAVAHNDPAVTDFSEVVVSYPALKVMRFYRTAHALLELGVPTLPRMLTELAHSDTGIDIHPAAQIGEYFAIDHGTGVVIGETCIIGRHVMLYQGVTLGARNFSYDGNGRPLDIPRHPILEDNVTVYSNTSILGRVTIGHDTIIGGNIWLTRDVPPNSRIVQTAARDERPSGSD